MTSGVYDLLLQKPLPEAWLRGLLFTSFALHLFFVLITLGTAILSFAYFINIWWGGRLDEIRWDKEIVRTFLAHKSLAVVLGVAPLLLMQVGHSVAFFTATSLLAPWWLLVIPLLIAAFLCLDYLGQRIEVHHYLHLVFGAIGLTALLAVPGIFVAVLTTAENPDRWVEVANGGYRLPAGLGFHWLSRYLHVLGASLVFGGLFHYFYSEPDETEKRRSLLRWVVGGILVQFVEGVALYGSLPQAPDTLTNAAVVAGVAGAAILVWNIFGALARNQELSLGSAGVPLLMVFIAMLLARQFNQDRVFIPLAQQAAQEAQQVRQRLRAFEPAALASYQASLAKRYDTGEALYRSSCAFCHGEDADGRAAVARDLTIAPANLAAMRTTRAYLHQILIEGITGTAMPSFGIFPRARLEELIDYLDRRYGVLQAPGPIPAQLSGETRTEANDIFQTTCGVCHGKDGKPTKLASGFRPPPRDFSLSSRTPERAMQIISDGIPGTMMPAFKGLPEDVRWGLVEIVQGFYTRAAAAAASAQQASAPPPQSHLAGSTPSTEGERAPSLAGQRR